MDGRQMLFQNRFKRYLGNESDAKATIRGISETFTEKETYLKAAVAVRAVVVVSVDMRTTRLHARIFRSKPAWFDNLSKLLSNHQQWRETFKTNSRVLPTKTNSHKRRLRLESSSAATVH